MNHHHVPRRWAAGLGLAAALIAIPAATRATPVIDGEKDAEYTLVASSPKDNLLTSGSDINGNPINDPADPRFKSLDVTNLWAASTGTDLYLYIELPYLDLNTIAGEWAVTFHLKGANDAIERPFATDPYGTPVDYGYGNAGNPGVNAVLKSNMLGFLQDYDGNQGYAFLNTTNKAQNGFNYDNGQFLTNTVTKDTVNNLIHGFGNSGGEVVYKGSKGIEVKIPLALFGTNPGNTDLVAPSPGDQILMQFYDNERERTTPNYVRGAVDAVPFEAGVQGDPTHSVLSTWASYTLTIPPGLEVGSVALKDPTDITHIVLTFSEAVGTGAGTAANYTVTNAVTGAAIPVTAAAVEATDAKKVDLTLAIPYNAGMHVVVKNVTAASGRALSTTKFAGDLGAYQAIQWNLYDPWGDISGTGTNPDTSLPYKITVTGDPISYRNDTNPATAGSNEIPMTLVPGSNPAHYQSAITLSKAGVIQYKYRFPELPDGGSYDDWNGLNPKDRRGFVAASSGVTQLVDNAAGTTFGNHHYGGDITATFTLVDRDNVAKGRPIYITGDMWNGFSTDPSVAWQLQPVAGQPNTYSVTMPLFEGWGKDTVTQYKYIFITTDPVTGNTTVDYDSLNTMGNRWAIFRAPGTSTNASIHDIASTGQSRMVRIMRTAAGLDPSPMWDNYYSDQDLDQSGSITLADALKAARS